MQALLQPEVLLELPVRDLLRLCSVDKEIQQNCQQDSFWELLTKLKFGPGLAQNCAKELYLIKSLLRELFSDTEFIKEALEAEDFAKANILLRMGMPYDF